jgi:glyoxylase-like metal-dependent hydrolase (beta-lactamase superfamily II)
MAIKESGIEKLLYIICTHGHFDHVSGVARLKEKYPEARVVVGEADAPALSSAFISGAEAFGYHFTPAMQTLL